MSKKTAQSIVRVIRQKGWSLLPWKGRRTPAVVLRQGIIYDIIPRKASDILYPVISVPSKDGFSALGRVTVVFGPGDMKKRQLCPGEEIIFIGIKLVKEEVRLIAASKTFMPSSVFLRALESLPDINNPDLKIRIESMPNYERMLQIQNRVRHLPKRSYCGQVK